MCVSLYGEQLAQRLEAAQTQAKCVYLYLGDSQPKTPNTEVQCVYLYMGDSQLKPSNTQAAQCVYLDLTKYNENLFMSVTSFLLALIHQLTLQLHKIFSKALGSFRQSTGCVKIKCPNTKIAISQKCVNIFAPNFALLQRIHHIENTCIENTHIENTYRLLYNLAHNSVWKVQVFWSFCHFNCNQSL